MSKPSRREFLLITGAAPLFLPILAKFTVASPRPESKNRIPELPQNPHVQRSWRRCSKCNLLFYNALEVKGVHLTGHCAAGGGHQAYTNHDYCLRYNNPDRPPIYDGSAFKQSGWRYCDKCFVLFYDGYADKGSCPATRNGHSAQGFNFNLSHDDAKLVGKPQSWNGCEFQNNWRYCSKCHAMFYDGELTPFFRGKCQVGGGQHLAQGYVFALEMAGNSCIPGDRSGSGFG